MICGRGCKLNSVYHRHCHSASKPKTENHRTKYTSYHLSLSHPIRYHSNHSISAITELKLNGILHLELLRNDNQIEKRKRKGEKSETLYTNILVICIYVCAQHLSLWCDYFSCRTVQQTVLTNCTYHVIWLSAPKENSKWISCFYSVC